MKKIYKILTLLLVISLVMGNVLGSGVVLAEEDTPPQPSDDPAILYVGIDPIIIIPGETIKLNIPIKAVYKDVNNPTIGVDLTSSPFSLVSKIELIGSSTSDGVSSPNGSVITTIQTRTPNVMPAAGVATAFISIELKINEDIEVGDHELKMVFRTYDNSGNPSRVGVVSENPIMLRVEKAKVGPSLNAELSEKPGNLKAGDKFNLKLKITNNGEVTAKSVTLAMNGLLDADKNDIFIPRYTAVDQRIGELKGGQSTTISLPFTVAKDAKIGTKKVEVTMTHSKSGTASDTTNIYLEIIKTTAENAPDKPNIIIENATYPGTLKAGTEFILGSTLHNKGLGLAKSIVVTVEGFADGVLIPNYITDIQVKEVKAGSKKSIKIPLIVSKTAVSGVQKLAVKVACVDEKGVSIESVTNLYLEITGEEKVDDKDKGTPNIVISGVTQSPSVPNAGGRVNISFTLENKSDTDIKEMKIAASNLTNANFSPVDLEPYQYIDVLKSGKKKQISMSFTVSDTVVEGLNELSLHMTYKDEKNVAQSEDAKLYIIDVVNEIGSVTNQGTPKLIVSDFKTDNEELMAGKIFTFSFDVLNTHASLSANNITATISSADDIFSIAKGSNSFYIDSIKPGEVRTNEVQLKIKNDAVTKPYPIEIKFEYEYEGIQGADDKGGAEKKNSFEKIETIKLQVLENARPVVNSVYVGSYDVPVINNPTTLTFEFYNMGRSVLNNVMARVEGDFASTSSMLYIGNVEAGSGDMQEMEVTPMLEGTSKGILILSYEDSNGDTIEVEKEFEAMVNGEMSFDDGMGMGNDFPIDIPVAKKEVVKPWIYIIIELLILGAGIFAARKVTLSLYKRRMQKLNDEEI